MLMMNDGEAQYDDSDGGCGGWDYWQCMEWCEQLRRGRNQVEGWSRARRRGMKVCR